jgi:hypothetical protein
VLPTYLTLLYYNYFPLFNSSTDPFDQSWTNPQMAPFGTLPTDPQVFHEQFLNPWRRIPTDIGDAWNPTKQGFLNYDFARGNEHLYNNDTGIEKLVYSFFPFNNVGLLNEDLFVDCIQEVHQIMDKSPLKETAYVYGPIFVYWEVFLELDRYCYMILAIDAGLIFFITLLISSFDFIASCITCTSCVMIATEVFGLSCLFMNFNIFVAAISLMGMGLSVEFTAHFSMAFSLATGTLTERLGTAMGHTFLATIEGSCSTFVCLLPLAFAPTLFEVKYIFGIVSIVILLGMINGLIFLPGMLAVLNPIITQLDKLLRK